MVATSISLDSLWLAKPPEVRDSRATVPALASFALIRVLGVHLVLK